MGEGGPATPSPASLRSAHPSRKGNGEGRSNRNSDKPDRSTSTRVAGILENGIMRGRGAQAAHISRQGRADRLRVFVLVERVFHPPATASLQASGMPAQQRRRSRDAVSCDRPPESSYRSQNSTPKRHCAAPVGPIFNVGLASPRPSSCCGGQPPPSPSPTQTLRPIGWRPRPGT